MKAIRPQQIGDPEVLELQEMPTPAPGSGEALVRVEAAGVNYIDVYHRTGLYPLPLPLQIGLEGAGTVERLGDGVGSLKVGDRVAWSNLPGSYATHVVAPVDKLLPVPAGLETRTAAAIPVQGMTAHFLTTSVFALGGSHTALVHAAAGGVGLLLVQMAKRAGAKVIGTVSTETKAELARQAGVDHVINYQTADFTAEVKRLTGDRGVDVVYDSVGKATFDGSLDCLASRGFMVLYGQSSGPVASFDPARLAKKSLFLTRPSVFAYTATRAELLMRASEVFGLAASGALRVRIERAYPLADAKDAHRALSGRKTTGKLLLVP